MSLPRFDVQDSDACPVLVCVFDDLPMAIKLLQLLPQSRNLTTGFRRMFRNIVKSDNSTRPYQRRIHLEVFPHAIIGMISINEENIQPASPQFSLRSIE